MKKHFLLLLIFLQVFLPAFSQGYSITNSTDVTNPVFAPNFSGMPDITNSSLTLSSSTRLRICGNAGGVAMATTWELRASVAGLDDPNNPTSPNVQYSDLMLANLMLANVMVLAGGTATLQPPFNSGSATFADILAQMNNALIVSGTGSTVGSSAGNCLSAMDGTNNRYWQYSSDITFTHDFYFNPTAYTPTIIYTLNCTSNCF